MEFFILEEPAHQCSHWSQEESDDSYQQFQTRVTGKDLHKIEDPTDPHEYDYGKPNEKHANGKSIRHRFVPLEYALFQNIWYRVWLLNQFWCV
jgi:hypothetical protein